MIPSHQPGKSLHSIISWFVVVLANLLFLPIFSMARTKQTPRKDDKKEKKEKTPSKWGTAAAVAFH